MAKRHKRKKIALKCLPDLTRPAQPESEEVKDEGDVRMKDEQFKDVGDQVRYTKPERNRSKNRPQ